MGSHSFCANLTHFEVESHSSEAADLDRSAKGGGVVPSEESGYSCIQKAIMG